VFVQGARHVIGILVGAGVMIASETCTLLGIEPFATWNTPIAWTGFILFADSVAFRIRRRSWIRSAPAEFAALALVSIPLWLVFEGYNLVIRNWHYTGLVENFWLRQFGFAWAFATIWPAIFESADMIGAWRRLPEMDSSRPTDGSRAWSRGSAISVAVGAIMLAAPFAVSVEAARYLAAPVWLGYIFLLDPVNRRLDAPSLAADLESGRSERLVNLMAGGVLCGVLWEFWNYWARSKWHYTVPILEHWKIFEMPVPGYLGFPAFALECFTMYVFVRRVLFPKLGYTIAL
jgi:hypothetical protein